jgi:hypothetical protein
LVWVLVCDGILNCLALHSGSSLVAYINCKVYMLVGTMQSTWCDRIKGFFYCEDGAFVGEFSLIIGWLICSHRRAKGTFTKLESFVLCRRFLLRAAKRSP